MYSLSPAMAPFSAELKSYAIQTRPHTDDTVSIVAVLTFRESANPFVVMLAMDMACESMRHQMENDLRQQALDLGVYHCYWQYQAECHYAAN